jgi:hypothetical protein
MPRQAIGQAVLVIAIAALVVAAGVALYYATSTSLGTGTTTTGRSAGYQINHQPYGIWANYLGFLPQGYVASPLQVNSATYPCPAGMSASACSQFQGTCGNGVCDPNESCSTCPIDCAPSGAATCDPYTGRTGAPIAVCFLNGAR